MATEATTGTAQASRSGAAPQGNASGLGGRYALALLELAKDKKSVDAVAADMERLEALWREDDVFRSFIADPRLDAAAQRRGAFAVLERAGVTGDVRNLVGVLIANRRLAALPQVAAAFGALLAEQRGQQTAEVTTAHKLTDVQRAQIAARLTEAGFPNVRLVETVDASILGGMVLKIGSRLYDTSIKSRLQRLSYAMKGAA